MCDTRTTASCESASSVPATVTVCALLQFAEVKTSVLAPFAVLTVTALVSALDGVTVTASRGSESSTTV